jgi:integrase
VTLRAQRRALTDTPVGPTKPGRSLTVKQARAVLEATRDDRLHAAYLVMLLLGLRPGEALGLPWEAVDLDSGAVRIDQALKVERGTQVVIGPLKTRGSRRTLALPAPVVDALRIHRQRQREERMASPVWEESGLVFTTTVGTAADPGNFRRIFGRAAERAGLGHWHPHELRHSAVSLLSAAGLRLEDVADVVGHVTTRMTHEVYRHQVTPTISTGKVAVERLFGGQSGGQLAIVGGTETTHED